jgi:pyruvate formate lyase activating enzyme
VSPFRLPHRCRDLRASALGGAGRAAEVADPLLYDLKQLDPARHRGLTGAGSEMILENLCRLLRTDTEAIVRVPVVPGANDDRESAVALAAFGRDELPPAHALGAHKYDALGLVRPVGWGRPGPRPSRG